MDVPSWSLGPAGRKKLRAERLQEKYLREKIIQKNHVAIKHRSVAVIVLPLFCQGMSFKIKKASKR